MYEFCSGRSQWLLQAVLFVSAMGTAHAASCDQLASLTIPFASVASATQEHSADAQAYCRVLITAAPLPDSEIHIETWLPEPNRWNGKFLGTGNGGYSSQLSYGEMRQALAKGYAVAGCDTGHAGGDLKFAVGHPAKVQDWAYRAVHVMTESAKPVLRSYYGRFAEHSYFAGCSTGGSRHYRKRNGIRRIMTASSQGILATTECT